MGCTRRLTYKVYDAKATQWCFASIIKVSNTLYLKFLVYLLLCRLAETRENFIFNENNGSATLVPLI